MNEVEATAPVPAAAPVVITGLRAADVPNDGGGSIRVQWTVPAGAAPGDSLVLLRAEGSSGSFVPVAKVPAAAGQHVDAVANGKTFQYQVQGSPAEAASASASASVFNSDRVNIFALLIAFLVLILIFIRFARQGRQLFIRRIAALEAIEEAVGRATEMGKSVLYVPGIDDANNIQTIYSMVILNSVAKMVAQYDTELVVPVAKSFVLPLAEETVRSAYVDVGRPDSFRPENIRYLSDEQFAFTAAVNGIMLRDRPATNLFLGSFFAESLVLAETGFSTGAVQIAGTANVHQLPFFVVACDYTMIGEEFFASSAYLAREPMLVGTLKATDALKLLLIVALVLGVALESVGVTGLNHWFEVH